MYLCKTRTLPNSLIIHHILYLVLSHIHRKWPFYIMLFFHWHLLPSICIWRRSVFIQNGKWTPNPNSKQEEENFFWMSTNKFCSKRFHVILITIRWKRGITHNNSIWDKISNENSFPFALNNNARDWNIGVWIKCSQNAYKRTWSCYSHHKLDNIGYYGDYLINRLLNPKS